ncbi:CHASE2 domain-containing protein [Nodosilinea sp. LEGE 07088]|uniref:CHASE2 domain-containing protein n=1 Tax=Nodosilinea sp. LEGE 07088 TaxID=2777968 RepID=UPI00187F8D23|nr:CHASE2 domain-containing protein [Nodosilinea sp. LEGE 07088]MBE9139137.1 CHASE2 domain-containing protein [Nodosilinea sp. LEGE 07088]
MTVRLDVRQQLQSCEFRLTWGDGQQLLPIPLPQPIVLMEAYQEWQRTYLNFYRAFRGRVVGVGHLTEVDDRRAQLVKAEADLLSEFHQWLRSPKLSDLRQQIAHLAKECSLQAATQSGPTPSLTIFLTCYPIELERLPWEAWEIGKELGTVTAIRLARTPDQIRAKPVKATRQGRNRVLVILGDDTGLDFKADREAVQGLSAIADIRFMGWQPGQDPTALLTDITEAITDSRGWDMLLFAGHSNEAATGGGELAIAPNLTLSVHELAPSLVVARQHGLQFALFNSCSGLGLARSLIDLGFNQVAILREPIHNQVAQEFLVQFLRGMAQHKDVHEALITAGQALKLEKNLTFPSSALVPSLFCRPGQPLFRFRKFGWREWLRQLRPTRRQALALFGVAGLSVWLPVQGALLEQRLWSQAVYRRLSGQTAGVVSPHPVTVIQIDETSLVKAGISEPVPMNRAYLAELLDQISQRQGRVIGVDYLLDRPIQATEDQAIAAALGRAAAQGTWLVLATMSTAQGEWSPILPEATFPSPPPRWSLAGDIWVNQSYLSVLNPWEDPTQEPLPFAYLLALGAELNNEPAATVPRPTPQNSSPLITQVVEYLDAQGQAYTDLFSKRSRHHLMTVLGYWVGQWWLQPVIDFSIPPAQVYQTLPAWQLLEDSTPELNLENHVVILAAGGYGEAGVLPGQDNWPLPAAVRHWRFWQDNPAVSLQTITGGELHAYMVHHLLTRHLVVPIPDLWMVGLAAILGQGTAIALQRTAMTHRQGYLLLIGATAAYGVLSLQMYVSAAILMPWLLPSLTVWIYALPAVNSLKAEEQRTRLANA